MNFELFEFKQPAPKLEQSSKSVFEVDEAFDRCERAEFVGMPLNNTNDFVSEANSAAMSPFYVTGSQTKPKGSVKMVIKSVREKLSRLSSADLADQHPDESWYHTLHCFCCWCCCRSCLNNQNGYSQLPRAEPDATIPQQDL